MKVWPFGVALRGEASNRLMLRWLKTVVVSDEEKAHEMRQVGTGKTTAVEASKLFRRHRNRGDGVHLGKSLAGARLLARWCPV